MDKEIPLPHLHAHALSQFRIQVIPVIEVSQQLQGSFAVDM